MLENECLVLCCGVGRSGSFISFSWMKIREYNEHSLQLP